MRKKKAKSKEKAQQKCRSIAAFWNLIKDSELKDSN